MDSELAAAIGRAVGETVVEAAAVERTGLEYDPFLAGRTLSRLRGTVATVAGPRAWSMIEKRTEGPSGASPYQYENRSPATSSSRSMPERPSFAAVRGTNPGADALAELIGLSRMLFQAAGDVGTRLAAIRGTSCARRR